MTFLFIKLENIQVILSKHTNKSMCAFSGQSMRKIPKSIMFFCFLSATGPHKCLNAIIVQRWQYHGLPISLTTSCCYKILLTKTINLQSMTLLKFFKSNRNFLKFQLLNYIGFLTLFLYCGTWYRITGDLEGIPELIERSEAG